MKTTLEPALSTIKQLMVNQLHDRGHLSVFYDILPASSNNKSSKKHPLE